MTESMSVTLARSAGIPVGVAQHWLWCIEQAGLLVVADDEYTVGKIVCVLGAYVWSSSQRERAKAILEALRSRQGHAMSYPHYSGDCHEFHDRVINWDGRRKEYREDAPIADPEIVVLCGSTAFKTDINRVNMELTMQGKLVISLGVFGHTDMPDHDWTTNGNDDKRMLDELHRRKIDLADRVHIVNPGGYIGESTRGEIEYAESIGKPITYSSSPAGIPTAGEAPVDRCDYPRWTPNDEGPYVWCKLPKGHNGEDHVSDGWRWRVTDGAE